MSSRGVKLYLIGIGRSYHFLEELCTAGRTFSADLGQPVDGDEGDAVRSVLEGQLRREPLAEGVPEDLGHHPPAGVRAHLFDEVTHRDVVLHGSILSNRW